MILPAALQHQARLPGGVSVTEAAGVKCMDTHQALGEFVNLVSGSVKRWAAWRRQSLTRMAIRSSTRSGSRRR
jgi:hypothetical protein